MARAHGGRVTDRALDAAELGTVLRRLGKTAKIDSRRLERFSGHSLRVGIPPDGPLENLPGAAAVEGEHVP